MSHTEISCRQLTSLRSVHQRMICRFLQTEKASLNCSDCWSRTIPTCVECIRAYQKRKPPRVIKDQVTGSKSHSQADSNNKRHNTLLKKLLDEMFTLYPYPKDLQIATLSNMVYNINYSSHKRSNSISAKHIFTTIPACESLLLPCTPVPMTGFVQSPTEVLRASCMCTASRLQIMFPHAMTYSTECFGYFPTSLTEKKSGEVRDFIAIILSSLCPLEHITRNPHITSSHDSSHARRV